MLVLWGIEVPRGVSKGSSAVRITDIKPYLRSKSRMYEQACEAAIK